MLKKLLASLATLSLGLGLAVTAASSASATDTVGTFGVAVPWSNENNHADWWEGNYPTTHNKVCVDGSSTYGTVTDDGKTVTLKPFDLSWGLGDHYELLVVKAGSADNNVIVHPQAGVNYASPINNGGQQATVSHWYVCFGTTPVTPQDVSGAATPVNQSCDTTTGSLVSGSITPTATTGVTYQLWDSTKTTLLIDNFAANSGALPNGSYYVKVLPASGAYTVSEANTWIPISVGAYGQDCFKITDVSGAATPINQSCDTRTGSLVSGSITPTATTGVTYQLWDSTKTTLLIDNFAANSGDLANGLYYVKVLPVDATYTVSEANTWIPITVGAFEGDCNEEVKVVGDPTQVQFCALDLEFSLFALNDDPWVAYLTIETSSSNPAGSVQYRVYFDDNGTWVDKGIWPEGTYNAGPDAGNPYEIPYGTKLKVVAEATSGYVISTPKEWEYTFDFPGLCVPTLGVVTPIITFDQTCAAGPTYTLGVEGGPAGSIVYSVNNGPFSAALGTFPATASTKFTIVADAVDPYGLSGSQTETIEVSHTYDPALVCGELTTLALTGQDPSPFLAMAGLLGLLGVGLVRTGNRNLRRTAN
jgi:hypothetical protein